jgi:ribosomal protein S18 acetylase RimI-like enzyme
LLEAIDTYCDAVPRLAARVEHIGPFSLFVRNGAGWAYYARPTLGAAHFTAEDVDQVRKRQMELDIPVSFEWIAETTPALQSAVEASGLPVTAHPLMVLDQQRPPPGPTVDGVIIRSATDDDDWAVLDAIAPIAFGAPGTAIGPAGLDELHARAAHAVSSRTAKAESLTKSKSSPTPTPSSGSERFVAVGFFEGQPVAIGSHQPVDGVTELAGIGVLPAFRRRGIAQALTNLLVDDALARGIHTVFLSAGDEATARVYQRVGFRLIGTACIAEPHSA